MFFEYCHTFRFRS